MLLIKHLQHFMLEAAKNSLTSLEKSFKQKGTSESIYERNVNGNATHNSSSNIL